MSDFLGISFVMQAVSESKPSPAQEALNAMRSHQVIGDQGISKPALQRRAEYGNPGIDPVAGRTMETTKPAPGLTSSGPKGLDRR